MTHFNTLKELFPPGIYNICKTKSKSDECVCEDEDGLILVEHPFEKSLFQLEYNIDSDEGTFSLLSLENGLKVGWKTDQIGSFEGTPTAKFEFYDVDPSENNAITLRIVNKQWEFVCLSYGCSISAGSYQSGAIKLNFIKVE